MVHLVHIFGQLSPHLILEFIRVRFAAGLRRPSAVIVIVQGVFFPAIHAMFGQWAPPVERSFLGSMSMAG